METWKRILRSTIPLATCFLVTGCGKQTVPLYPVSGTVFYRGKPAVNAQVVFHDQRPVNKIHELPIPRGRTNVEGKFHLSCHEPGDGAPAGEYVVTVMLASIKPADLAPRREEENADPEAAGVQMPVEGMQYMDPATSGLKATVLEEENMFPPFELN
jgi:hypothetical protein